MKNTLIEYIDGETELTRLRAFGLATEAVEDRYADLLENLWWRLTVDERKAADDYFAEPSVAGPDTTRGVVDVANPDREFPRRQAA